MDAAISKKRISLEIIIPVYNEEKMLPQLIDKLKSVFSPAALLKNGVVNIHYVMVDDGSKDQTAGIIYDEIQKAGIFAGARYQWNRGAKRFCQSRRSRPKGGFGND